MTIAPPARDKADSIHAARILIVDDDPLICQLVVAILKSKGFVNLDVAGGGHAALERIRDHEPDLLLLDMRMPDLDGMEVCRRIRSQPRLADLPILVQTAAVDRSEMGKTFAAGASDFLSKPVNPVELLSRVITHVERRILLRELRAYRERTSRELEAARQMQLQLLPSQSSQERFAVASGLRIASYFRPSSEIGGDIWGLLPVDANSFGIFLADLVGHGVSAALNTFRLHAIIHQHAGLYGDPAAFLSVLNERLVPLFGSGQFATFLYAVVEPALGRIRFASAGAPCPMIADRVTRSVTLTHASGIPLGVTGQATYKAAEHEFTLDARMVLFSDGLSELPCLGNGRPGDDRLGEDRLLDIVASCAGALPPEAVIAALRSAAHIGADETLPDDTTIICIDRAPAARATGAGHDP